MLLFVSVDGNCSFMLIKAYRTRIASQVSCVTLISGTFTGAILL